MEKKYNKIEKGTYITTNGLTKYQVIHDDGVEVCCKNMLGGKLVVFNKEEQYGLFEYNSNLCIRHKIKEFKQTTKNNSEKYIRATLFYGQKGYFVYYNEYTIKIIDNHNNNKLEQLIGKYIDFEIVRENDKKPYGILLDNENNDKLIDSSDRLILQKDPYRYYVYVSSMNKNFTVKETNIPLKNCVGKLFKFNLISEGVSSTWAEIDIEDYNNNLIDVYKLDNENK